MESLKINIENEGYPHLDAEFARVSAKFEELEASKPLGQEVFSQFRAIVVPLLEDPHGSHPFELGVGYIVSLAEDVTYIRSTNGKLSRVKVPHPDAPNIQMVLYKDGSLCFEKFEGITPEGKHITTELPWLMTPSLVEDFRRKAAIVQAQFELAVSA